MGHFAAKTLDSRALRFERQVHGDTHLSNEENVFQHLPKIFCLDCLSLRLTTGFARLLGRKRSGRLRNTLTVMMHGYTLIMMMLGGLLPKIFWWQPLLKN